MKQQVSHITPAPDQQLTLGEALDFLMAARDVGAPRDTELVMMLGDRGSQRDPAPFLRGLSVTWDTA